MECLRLLQEGVALELHVVPGASFTKLGTIYDGRLKVYVSSAPENGKANLEVLRFLAKLFGVSKSSISIIKGSKSRKKVALVTEVTLQDIQSKLENYSLS